jgi:hypothetical protein
MPTTPRRAMMDRSKFRVEVRHRSTGSLFYRWSIYYGPSDLAPLKSSTGLYPTKAEALTAGSEALDDFLRRLAAKSELNDD